MTETPQGIRDDDAESAIRYMTAAYRSGLAPLELKGKTVILIDDGLATGSTMLAAIRASPKAGAAGIVVGAPVASPEAAELVRGEADYGRHPRDSGDDVRNRCVVRAL